MTVENLFEHFSQFFFEILICDIDGKMPFERRCNPDRSDASIIYAEALHRFGNRKVNWWAYDYNDNTVSLQLKGKNCQNDAEFISNHE